MTNRSKKHLAILILTAVVVCLAVPMVAVGVRMILGYFE